MESKNQMFQRRSCSAVQTRTAGESWKDSNTGSLTNLSYTRQSMAGTDYLRDVLSKKISNQKSNFSISTVQNRNIYNNKKQNEATFLEGKNICQCSDCTSLEDILSSSSYNIQDLNHKLQELSMELIKEKNSGQILRRDILVAKKVIEMETAANTQDFENLLEKANNRSWKGRQEIIFVLRRKLRDLNEVADSLNDGTKNIWTRKKTKLKMDDLTEIITDESKIRSYLELERKKVSKNAERYRQKFVASRDLMASSLEQLTKRNEKLMKEIRILQKKLSTVPKQIDEELIKRLHDVKVHLKSKLEEKAEERRKIDILEEEDCRNCKIKEELKAALAAEKEALKEKGEKLISLKEESTKLLAMSENVKKEKVKQAAIMKKKIEDVEYHYDKITTKSKKLINQLTDSKYLLEKGRIFRLKESSISIIRQSVSSCPTKIIKEKMNYQDENISYSKLSKGLRNNWTCIYKNKLLKYQSIFHILDIRNEDKVRNFFTLVNETKEGFFELLENRYLMRKITTDIKILKIQNKKLKKRVLYSTKLRLAKRKSSSQQIEVLNERKTYIAIMKKENKCLQSLIRGVLSSKENDCDALESYLTRNKDIFLKKLTRIKV